MGVSAYGRMGDAGTEIVLNQIAMDQFPSVHAFVTVLKEHRSLRRTLHLG
jgi:hypothetical protein